jgi:predicted MPP superfamily phosphohydrolase
MSNETKISKLSTKTSLSKLGSKTSKLKKLESFKSKLGKAQAKRISLDGTFIGTTSFELNDNLFIVDDFKASIGYPESFSDTILIDETFLNTLLNSVNFDDDVDILQTSSNALNNSINLETEPDTASVSDELNVTVDFVTNFTGTITTEDSINFGVTTSVIIPEPIQPFNLETDTYNSCISYFIYGVFVNDEIVGIVIRNPLPIQLISPLSLSQNLGNLTFQWEADEFSNQYELQVGTSPNFLTGIVINQTAITGTSYTPTSILANNTYYCRIRGKNTTNGKFGPWSTTRTFNTIALQPPVITYPANNQLTSKTVVVKWNAATLAEQYEYNIATDINFSNEVAAGLVTGTSVSVILPNVNTTYYLRMRSRTTTVTSSYGSTITFSSLLVSLGDSVTSTDSLTNQVAFEAVLNESITSQEVFDELQNKGISPLDSPILIAPTDAGTFGQDVLFIWDEVLNATQYRFQYSINALFNSIVGEEVLVGAQNTQKVIENLTDGITYYWRVRAENATQQSEYVSRSLVVDTDYVYTVYPYQLLSDDATNKTFINYVDDSISVSTTGKLYYGETLNSLVEVSIPSGDLLSGTTRRVFSTHLTGLVPDTTYKCFIKTGNNNYSKIWNFKTEPVSLGANPYKVAFLSDIHIEDNTNFDTMFASSEMGILRAQDPNILCIVGDIVSLSDSPDATKSGYYIKFFKEHINTYLYTDKTMIPMVVVPGNHDMGELVVYNPDTINTVTTGYFQTLFPTFKVTNANKNHGYVTVGDYLKLVGMDFFSSNVATQNSLIANAGTAQEYVIPFSHFPILPSTTRNLQDKQYFPLVLKGLAKSINDNTNIKAYFTGHMHTKYDSKRWKVINQIDDPSGYFIKLTANANPTPNDYLVLTNLAVEGKKEFGSGYKNNRPLGSTTEDNIEFGNSATYVNNVTSVGNEESTFYVVTLKTEIGAKQYSVKQITVHATASEGIFKSSTTINMLEDETLETEPITGTTVLAIDWDTVEGEWE